MSEPKQYIGYIEKGEGKSYFRPVYIVNSDSVKPFLNANAEFPKRGNLYLCSCGNQFNSGEIVIFTLDGSDLDDNVRSNGDYNSTHHMVDPQKLKEQGKIKRLADFNMYPVLHPVHQIDFSKTTIPLKEMNIDVQDPCLIEEDGVLYGPCYDIRLDDHQKALANLPDNYIAYCYRPRNGALEDVILKIRNVSIIRLDNKLDKLIWKTFRQEEFLREEIRSLNAEKEALQREIDEIRLQRNQWKELNDLNKEKEFLERQNSELRDKLQKYKVSSRQAEAELNARLSETIEKNAVNAAFDGKIAGQVLQAAAKWNQTSQDENFERIAAILTGSNETPAVSGDTLVEYLISSVKRYRPGYSRNDILNIFLCVTQNFLTVFSGEPGTGKTSISNIVAHILGTSIIKNRVPEESGIELSRYVPVSIERGWTSKRDFIGYYNPLSQTFEQANKHLYDGLRLLNAEGEKSKYPYIVLLDEANLSPIEYYWADFMNLCDSNSRFSKITLGNDIQLRIPPTLRFLATINNDDTTERLSPRLIDRAALICLPNVPYTKAEDEGLTDTSFVNIVEWAALQDIFAPDVSLELDPVPNKIYEEICKLFRETMRLSISPRVDRAIKRYWAAAKDLFESEKGSDPAIIALDYAAAQKLLPKINGSGKTYSELLGKFLELCEKHNLEKSRTMLANIIRRGDTSMGYYQYF